MFAKYIYKAGSNLKQVFDDLRAIIAGETDVNNLSASSVPGSSYIVSTDPSGWTEVATGLHDIYDSGNLNALGTVNAATWAGTKYIAVSANGIANSVDGKTWVRRSTATGFVSVGYSATSGLSLAVRIVSTTATVYYSSDSGDTWTVGGTYPVTAGSNPFVMGVKGSTFYLMNPNGASSNIYTTTNGTSITTVPVGTSATYRLAVSNGSSVLLFNTAATCISSANGSTWVNTSVGSSGCYCIWTGTAYLCTNPSSTRFLLSSSDGINWTALPTPPENFRSLALVNGVLIATGASASFYESHNLGQTWLSRPGPVLVAPYAVTTNGMSAVVFVLNTSYLIGPDEYNRVYKALCADGTSYKYVELKLNILATPPNLQLRVYEGYDPGSKAFANIAYGSNADYYAQQIDIAGGGLVFIGASSRYLTIFSYITTSNAWGGTAGSCAVACVEGTRDDPWNKPGVYPTWYWTGTAAFACYSPRYKYAPGLDRVSSISYHFATRGTALTATQALDDNDLGYYMSQDIAVSSLSQGTGGYAVLGGVILGGLKMSQVGSTGDEFLIGTDYYVVFNVGATNRWLIPKR